MTKNKWKQKITECCRAAGTYEECFNDIIETLAQILEERDKVKKQYKDTGGHPVISYTNKAGAKNPAKNPMLLLWNDLNNTALSYWRDLGLTPAGLKKLDGDALKKKKANSFSEFLMGRIGDEQEYSN